MSWVCAGQKDAPLTPTFFTGVLENDRPHAGTDDGSTAGACLARRKAFATSTQLPRGGNDAPTLYSGAAL